MKAHRHKCSRCEEPFDCDGELSRNHDGWPEVVCARYHIHEHTQCDDCAEKDATTQGEANDEPNPR